MVIAAAFPEYTLSIREPKRSLKGFSSPDSNPKSSSSVLRQLFSVMVLQGQRAEWRWSLLTGCITFV
jgi:hypothetical protein